MDFCLKAIKYLHNRSVKQRRELEENEPVTSPPGGDISVPSPPAGDSSVTEPATKQDDDSSMEEMNNEHPVTNDVTPVTNENGNAPSPSSKTEEMGDKEGPQILT